MTALERINAHVSSHPGARSNCILTNLVAALRSGSDFRLSDLYDLTYEEFKLALDLLQYWRLGRFTSPNDERMSEKPLLRSLEVRLASK